MAHWSEGYVNDINYTPYYYKELNPERLIIPFLIAGIAPPAKISHACELGFGQGVSVNLHAIAGGAKWHATDFNPSQANFAQHLFSLSDADSNRLHISDKSFAEFCKQDDLPDFDFIGLHGIWSWISDENRHIITDFLRRKLKVGGVLYISYNTLPGWSSAAPIRHLLAQHNSMMASPASNRADNAKLAVEFGKQVIELSHSLNSTTPFLASRIAQLETMSPNYLAHEYLNKDWHPMYFAQMAQWLGDAKLSYACSANYFDDFAPVLFDDEQQQFFDSIQNLAFAQTIKDYLLNKQFRRDLWVKGIRQLNSHERTQQMMALGIMLTIPRNEFVDTISNNRTTTLIGELFHPVLDILADGKIHSVQSLHDALGDTLSQEQLFLVVAILHDKEDIVLCRTPSDDDIHASQTFNHTILADKRPNPEVSYLASPITGGGIHFSYPVRLLLALHQQGHQPEDWPKMAWQILQEHNQLMVKDRMTLQSEDENLAELARLKDEFLAHYLDLAKRLLII